MRTLLTLSLLLALSLVACGDSTPGADATTDVGQDSIGQDTGVTVDTAPDAAMMVGQDAGMDATR